MSKSKKTGLSWFSRFVLVLNCILIIALLLSYLSPCINPNSFWIPAMFGLFYPAIFIFNCLFVIYWIFKFKYYFLFSLVALLLGIGVFFEYVRFNREKPVGNYSDALKVLSYNVRLFDQYKATPGQEYFTPNSIFRMIKEENADVVCFQEFFHGNEKYFPTIGPFMESQGTGFYHTDYVKIVGDWKHYGLATFSKYPIVNKGNIRFEGSTSNSGIFSDIVFKNDTIRVFNLHLQSIRFSKADYQFVSEFIDPGIQPNSSSSKVIFWKLKNAFIKRSEQAAIVAKFIKESPHPVVVCGDFNDTPTSFTYHTIANGLKDAFVETGRGVGSTYAGTIPFLRIDYILHSDKLEPCKFTKHLVNYSDHYPVSCYFKLK